MASGKNDRKINSLLQQMQQRTGLTEYKEKMEAEQQKENDLSPLIKDLSQLEQQDPMRVAPIAKENNREERKIESLRHRERQNIMMRVDTRQRQRGGRTYP